MSLSEISELLSWIGDPPRHPRQTHGLNESDCEVVDLGNGTYLASTIDTISEEISAGLYRDPYRIGWVTAMASLSDLAAVGARPIGMLLSAEWGGSDQDATKAEIARGFSDALRRCSTYWLGGDTGRSRSTSLAGVGLGLCEGKPLSRLGMRPGDRLCVTGKLGNGPALAIRFLLGQAEEEFSEKLFEPVARLDAGLALRDLASAAMDTSDGLLSTLSCLSHLNGSGLELIWREGLISEPARAYCRKHGVPLWALWEVEHGDYQLVVSIPEKNLEKAMALVPDLHCIGQVTDAPGISIELESGRTKTVDPEFARTLLSESNNDMSQALRKLIQAAKERELP